MFIHIPIPSQKAQTISTTILSPILKKLLSSKTMTDAVSRVITKALSIKTQPQGTFSGITKAEVLQLTRAAKSVILSEPGLLEVSAPITIVGDIHGQFHDLLRIFDRLQYPPDTRYLFLGDYVDRGPNSIECICLLLAYKVKYPDRIYLLRGNHECSAVNRPYGFFGDVTKYFSTPIYKDFSDVFNSLPLAAIVQEKIFCVHGGLSEGLRNLDQIRLRERPNEIQEGEMFADLLWADPNLRPDPERFDKNERGTGVVFSIDAVRDFLMENQLQFIARAHQAVKEGYEFPYPDSTDLVTIFSAPNYLGQFGNKAAVMVLDAEANPTFVQFEPIRREGDLTIRPATPEAVTGYRDNRW
jgi:serine/threonine-protein phosphatase PP1 catalytic subunit